MDWVRLNQAPKKEMVLKGLPFSESTPFNMWLNHDRTILQRADRDRAYRLFVLHDADPAGYNIARTLRDETHRMPGYHVMSRRLV
jgi:hypothetical protein